MFIVTQFERENLVLVGWHFGSMVEQQSVFFKEH